MVLNDDGKVAKVKIYRAILGVPITFLDKYNPSSTVDQHNLAKMFEIVGKTDRQDLYLKHLKHYTKEDSPKANDLNRATAIKTGPNSYRGTYQRLFIRQR